MHVGARTIRRIGIVALLALLVLTANAVGGGPTTFTDPSGDAGGAPDITAVAIASDPSSGSMELSVTMPGFFAIDRAAMPDVDVYLDTDKNATTGAPGTVGAEYDLYAFASPTGGGWNIDRWNGSDWEDLPHGQSVSFVVSGDTMTWRFARADLGGATGFNFRAVSAIYSASYAIVALDDAPDGGFWIYDVPAPVIKPVIGAAVATPTIAVAGKRMTVTFPVTRSDNGAPLTAGTMICDPSVNSKVVTHAESFIGGTAKLSFLVPKSAKGKQLKVKVTIKAPNGSATRIATYRVR